MLKLGLAVRDITPANPEFLSGFAHRRLPSQDIQSHLFIRAFAFEDRDSGERAAVVSADLIGWDAEQIIDVERWSAEKFGTSLVIFNATHTHSGPCVMLQGHDILRAKNGDYLTFLYRETRSAIREAFETLEEVRIFSGSGIASGIMVNRRLKTLSGIECQPNPEGLKDEEITLWRFDRNDNSTKAFWIHAACHPTILSENAVSSEYPGEVTRRMEEAYPGSVCAFLQGCCGDVRPNFSDERGIFRKTTEEDLQMFSSRLFECVYAISRKSMSYLGDGALSAERRDFNQSVQRGILEGDGRISVNIRISGLRLTGHAALIAFPGEPSIFYQHFVKSLGEEAVLPLGYSNGTPGYLPTAEQIREGGYESVGSCKFFSLAGPFEPSLEGRLRSYASAVYKDLFSNAECRTLVLSEPD